MFTRAKLKVGEGKINTFNLEIGRATRWRKIEDEELCADNEEDFHIALYRISSMVEKLFAYYEKRLAKKEKKKKDK